MSVPEYDLHFQPFIRVDILQSHDGNPGGSLQKDGLAEDPQPGWTWLQGKEVDGEMVKGEIVAITVVK